MWQQLLQTNQSVMLRLTSFREIIYDAMYDHVKEGLYPQEFGFREKRSAVLQLLFYLNKFYEFFDPANQQLSALYLNFCKTFDTVSHGTFLLKISEIMIGGILLKLRKCYLTNRLQYIHRRDRRSRNSVVNSGVP